MSKPLFPLFFRGEPKLTCSVDNAREDFGMVKDYDVIYSDDRHTLVMKANLEKGWRRLEKTYGFFRTMWVWYTGDFRVRTQLSALAQPGTFHESASEFPNVALSRGDEQMSFKIHEKILEARVALNAEQPWRLMMDKRPGLFFDDLSIDIGQSRFWLDLRAWVVFHPPSRAPIPDVRVWCQRLFVPGGQAESNRRRH